MWPTPSFVVCCSKFNNSILYSSGKVNKTSISLGIGMFEPRVFKKLLLKLESHLLTESELIQAFTRYEVNQSKVELK